MRIPYIIKNSLTSITFLLPMTAFHQLKSQKSVKKAEFLTLYVVTTIWARTSVLKGDDQE